MHRLRLITLLPLLMLAGCAPRLGEPWHLIRQSSPTEALRSFQICADELDMAGAYTCIAPEQRSELRRFFIAAKAYYDEVDTASIAIQSRLGKDEADQFQQYAIAAGNISFLRHEPEDLRAGEIEIHMEEGRAFFDEGSVRTGLSAIRHGNRWYIVFGPPTPDLADWADVAAAAYDSASAEVRSIRESADRGALTVQELKKRMTFGSAFKG